MAVAKRQGREKPAKTAKEGPRSGVRTSGGANSTAGCPAYTGQARGEEKTHEERSQRSWGVSLLCAGVLPNSLLFASSGGHALAPRGWIFLLFSK